MPKGEGEKNDKKNNNIFNEPNIFDERFSERSSE